MLAEVCEEGGSPSYLKNGVVMPGRAYRDEFSFHNEEKWYRQEMERRDRREKIARAFAIVVAVVLAVALMLVGLSSCYNATDTSVPTVVTS